VIQQRTADEKTSSIIRLESTIGLALPLPIWERLLAALGILNARLPWKLAYKGTKTKPSLAIGIGFSTIP
jgi:hypothetical protein